MLIPLIPTRAHGMLDYICAIALIAMLWIYDLSVYTYAPWVILVAGICIIISGLLTKYERGYLGLISMRTHLWLDLLVGLILITTPYLLDEQNAKLPQQAMGAVIIFFALFTKPVPTSAPVPRLTAGKFRK